MNLDLGLSFQRSIYGPSCEFLSARPIDDIYIYIYIRFALYICALVYICVSLTRTIVVNNLYALACGSHFSRDADLT